MNEYEIVLSNISNFIFYIKIPIVLPQYIISGYKDIILEEGDHFRMDIEMTPNGIEYTIIIIQSDDYEVITINDKSSLIFIIHNSTLNESNKTPLFIECSESYRRNEIIDDVLNDGVFVKKKYSQMNEYKDWSKVSNFLSCGLVGVYRKFRY